MNITLKYFAQDIGEEYDVLHLVLCRYVYIKIRKGMYGLKEAGILVFNYIVENLVP